MLKPSKMNKVRLIISKHYYDDSISALQDIGAMQIDTLSDDAAMLGAVGGMGGMQKEISDLAQRFRGLESMLYKKQADKRTTFMSIEQLLADAKAIKIDDRVSGIKKELDGIAAEEKEDMNKLSLLERMKDFNRDMSILNSNNIRSFMIYGKDAVRCIAALRNGLQDIAIIALKNAFVVGITKDGEKDFSNIAGGYKIWMESIPEMEGVPSKLIEDIKKRGLRLAERKVYLQNELNAISDRWYPEVGAVREQLDIEMEKIEVANKIGRSESVAIIEGWIPSNSLGKVEESIKNMSSDHFVLETIKADEQPPTQFDNPVWARLFEFFIRFYSLPKSDEIDPTVIFALVFPIFFGFMVGDFGYGLIMLLGSLWLIHRLNHPVKKSKLPRPLTKFVTMIVGQNGLMTIARAIIPGAIIAMVLGVLFNEYMGFQLPYTALFNVEVGLPTLLVAVGWIGVAMVEFGFALGFINNMAHGNKKHAAAKIGWMLAAIGIVIFGLNVLHKASLSTPLSYASFGLIIAGVGTVLYGEGVQSMMELPSIVSHILSYVRLVGILLTSVILAGIIDLIFLHGVDHSLLLGIVGVLILIVGQIFNLIIALFEAGIQGARLIYVEFFSKFYTGNGIPFRPFKSRRQRTLSRFDL